MEEDIDKYIEIFSYETENENDLFRNISFLQKLNSIKDRIEIEK